MTLWCFQVALNDQHWFRINNVLQPKNHEKSPVLKQCINPFIQILRSTYCPKQADKGEYKIQETKFENMEKGRTEVFMERNLSF